MTHTVNLHHYRSVPRQPGAMTLNEMGKELSRSPVYHHIFSFQYSLLIGVRVGGGIVWSERPLFCRIGFGVRATVRFKDQPILGMNQNSKAERYFALQRDSNFIKRNC